MGSTAAESGVDRARRGAEFRSQVFNRFGIPCRDLVSPCHATSYHNARTLRRRLPRDSTHGIAMDSPERSGCCKPAGTTERFQRFRRVAPTPQGPQPKPPVGHRGCSCPPGFRPGATHAPDRLKPRGNGPGAPPVALSSATKSEENPNLAFTGRHFRQNRSSILTSGRDSPRWQHRRRQMGNPGQRRTS